MLKDPLFFIPLLLLRIIITTVLCVLLASCKPAEINSAEDLEEYIKDPGNNLSHLVESKGYKIYAAYKPADLLLNDRSGKNLSDRLTLRSFRSSESDYYYFTLSILAPININSSEQQDSFWHSADARKMLAFSFGNSISMITSLQDTIPLHDFEISNTEGTPETLQLLLYFNKERAKECEWIQLHVNEFGLGTGEQSFRFQTQDIEEIPQLHF